MNEAAPRKKIVVRNGKRVIIWDCPPGYKKVGKRCVKMGATELRKRSLIAKRVARKLRGRRQMILKKRARSMMKRSRMGL